METQNIQTNFEISVLIFNNLNNQVEITMNWVCLKTVNTK